VHDAGRSLSVRPFLLALAGVALWSTSALVAVAAEDSTNAATLVLGAILGGLAVNAAFAARARGPLRAAWHACSSRRRRSFLISAAACGLLLVTYQWLYYHALQRGPAVPVNIINYLWPVLMSLMGHAMFGRQARLTGSDLGLLVLAFAGASVVALDLSPSGPVVRDHEWLSLVLAFVGAITAAAYFNLVLVARRHLEEAGVALPPVSAVPAVYAVGFAACVPIAIALVASGAVTLRLGTTSLLATAHTGLVIFGAGHLLVLTALAEARTQNRQVTVTAITYLTPIVSTVLLSAVLGEALPGSVALGAAMIVVANTLLLARYRHLQAMRGSFIAFFVAGLVVYLEPKFVMEPEGWASRMPNEYLAGAFSILAAFILGRVWNRNRDESKLIGEINADVARLVRTSRPAAGSGASSREVDDALAELVEAMVDFSYSAGHRALADNGAELNRSLDALERVATGTELVARVGSLRDRVTAWRMLSLDRLAPGEMLLLAALGLMSVVSFVAMSGESFLGDLFTVGFAAATAYVLLLIRDYNLNRSTQDARRVAIMQEPLLALGRPYYVPAEELLVEMSPADADVRVRVGRSADERLATRWLDRERRWLRTMAVGLSIGSIAVVVALFAAKEREPVKEPAPVQARR
jgi:drug/metabolite transporter (DMT)-like permease